MSLPQPGDTLISAIDEFYQPAVGPASPNAQTWDFSGLQGYGYDTMVFRDTSTSPSSPAFQNADMVFNFLFGDAFATRTSDAITIIGFGGELIPGVSVESPLIDPQVYRRANFNYGDGFADTGAFILTLDGSLVPPGALPVTPDSIRVNYYGTGSDTADAFGSLTTPTGTFDVLRLKRIQNNEAIIEAKFPFVGWSDITNLLPDLGFGTTIFYDFLSDSSKTPIATVVVDNDGIPIRTVFRVDTTLPTPPPVGIAENEIVMDVSIFPNPSSGSFSISTENAEGLPSEISIFNTAGQQIYSKRELDGLKSIELNLDLAPGVYILIGSDNGEIIQLRQSLVIK